MKKPQPKTVSQLDFSECTAFIEKKYNIDTRDFAGSHSDFGNWCKAHNEKQTTCAPKCSAEEMRQHQEQYARYNAGIASGAWKELPYQDFWHWLLEVADVRRGGTLELDSEMVEGAEDWQKHILGLYLTEFGKGPYLTDW